MSVLNIEQLASTSAAMGFRSGCEDDPNDNRPLVLDRDGSGVWYCVRVYGVVVFESKSKQEAECVYNFLLGIPDEHRKTIAGVD